ncbi:MAG: ABC transporter ATP-binding protein [Pseudomonadota bacterium]
MLNIQGLTKTYANGVEALKGVSLKVPKGMFGLLGPNGAGKSTLMRTVATLQSADDGTVELNGSDVGADVTRLRRTLGYLPQEFGVYPRTSPLAFLEHIATLKGITDKGDRSDLVENLLVQTNLWDVRKKNMTTFSGGMKQRIGIAQALIGQPELIIVDEPTAGLDPVERRRFHNLLASIGEDVVVILSTHIVEDVADLCTRMAIMAGGNILSEGEPQELIRELEGRLWRTVVTHNEADRVKDHVDVLTTRRVAGRTEIKTCAQAAPIGFEAAAPGLEDVYFATLAQAGFSVEVD